MEGIKSNLQKKSYDIEKIKNKRSTNSTLVINYDEKPVLFNPGLGRISKSATAGLFMSQLLYWHGKGRNKDWTYKTINEFKEETCLTRSEQERAIKIWKELGVLEVELRSIPRRRFFRIELKRLEELLKVDYKKRHAESNK